MAKNKKTYTIKLSITVDPNSTLNIKQIAPCIVDEVQEAIINMNTDDEVLVQIDSMKVGR